MAVTNLELKEITSVQLPVLLSVSCRHRMKINHCPFDNPSIMEQCMSGLCKMTWLLFQLLPFRSATEEAVMHNKSVVPS